MKQCIKYICFLGIALCAFSASAMELSDRVDTWRVSPQTMHSGKMSDMDILTDNEMDAVTAQHSVAVMLEGADGSSAFEVHIQFTTASFGDIIEFTQGDTVINGQKLKSGFIVFRGPTGESTEMLAELTASVPSGSMMEMEVNTTGSAGLDIGGTKAFEIPPYTTFARVSIPDIEYDIYVAEDMKIILDSIDTGSSPTARTLGILRLFDLDFDLKFPKESSIYIYPS
ncbi:MAG: hypothetical protein OMM_01253 [Candidatus Magnetoglobus multicellularis str. Araruama]|uniref:Uncharacterized protein n=1 Tax=Candidatus Magnetoglobus multicellularis str. Araruama TaxID=890399 RepID=A0A1V1PE21_9BACT|nr:MAG: hypothetical protein OMM_01253 [Candidatus Magnetoglobus multicellularis str. Araruama]